MCDIPSDVVVQYATEPIRVVKVGRYGFDAGTSHLFAVRGQFAVSLWLVAHRHTMEQDGNSILRYGNRGGDKGRMFTYTPNSTVVSPFGATVGIFSYKIDAPAPREQLVQLWFATRDAKFQGELAAQMRYHEDSAGWVDGLTGDPAIIVGIIPKNAAYYTIPSRWVGDADTVASEVLQVVSVVCFGRDNERGPIDRLRDVLQPEHGAKHS